MGELIFNVLLLIFFLVSGFYATQINISGDVNARTWPMVIIGATVIMLAYKIFKIWKALPKEERKLSLGTFKLIEKGVQNFLLSIVWLLAYIVALPYAGYVLSTIIFFMGMAWLIGARKLPSLILISIAVTAVVWAVFVWGLNLHPPRGIGFLEDFSIWLEYLI